jgi:hypothetical protein
MDNGVSASFGGGGFTFGGLNPGEIGAATTGNTQEFLPLDKSEQDVTVTSCDAETDLVGDGDPSVINNPMDAPLHVKKAEPMARAAPSSSFGFSFGSADSGDSVAADALETAEKTPQSKESESASVASPPLWAQSEARMAPLGDSTLSSGHRNVQSNSLVVPDTLSLSSGGSIEENAPRAQSHSNKVMQLLTPKRSQDGEKLQFSADVFQNDFESSNDDAPMVTSEAKHCAATTPVARPKRAFSKKPGPWLNAFKSLAVHRRKEVKTDFKYLMNVWVRLTADKRRHLVHTALHMWGKFDKAFVPRKNSTEIKRLLPSQSELDLLRNISLRLNTQERNQIGALLLETAYRAGSLLKYIPDWCVDADCFQGIFTASGSEGSTKQ